MKQIKIIILSMICLFALVSCRQSMNHVIENEKSFIGKVVHLDDDSILVDVNENDPIYNDYQRIDVSLEVEYKDSMTHFNIGDEVVVYYRYIEKDTDQDELPEVDDPIAITLRTPVKQK